MALESGTRLGPYEILSPLGAGGMGEVYRARDTRLDRTVALKILPARLAESPARRQRFEREARAVSSLNHPHICVLHDIRNQDGIAYLVLEHLEEGYAQPCFLRAMKISGGKEILLKKGPFVLRTVGVKTLTRVSLLTTRRWRTIHIVVNSHR